MEPVPATMLMPSARAERARPAADHVVVAGVAVVAEDRRRQGVQHRRGLAVLAVGGQPEECVGDLRCVDAGVGQQLGDARAQDVAHAVQADVADSS